MKCPFKEDDLQAAQVSYLADRRDMKRDLMFCAIPNAAKRGFKLAAIMKKTGLVAGAPDLVIWMRGKTIQVENKVKGRTTTGDQDWFGERLAALGHSYHVITAADPSDAVTQLEALLA